MHKKILYAVIVMLIGIVIILSVKAVNLEKDIQWNIDLIKYSESQYPNYELPKDVRQYYILKYKEGK